MSGTMGASGRSMGGSPAWTASVSGCGITPVYGTLWTLEAPEADPPAVEAGLVLGDDADGSVLLEHREADLVHLLDAVLPQRHLSVLHAEVLLREVLRDPFAVTGNHGRLRVDQGVDGRKPPADEREPTIDEEQGHDEDHP